MGKLLEDAKDLERKRGRGNGGQTSREEGRQEKA
jgi:hypothetical protein